MKATIILPLLASSFLLVGTTQAQASFSFGPQVGASLAKAHFVEDEHRTSTTHRWGFEAGLTGNLQLGRFALQPSVLFSQKGYRSTGSVWLFEGGGNYTETFRLNYLTLPLNLALTLGQGGQGEGVQVFAGPYVSLLVGGNYARQEQTFSFYQPGSSYALETRGKVNVGSEYADYRSQYSKRFDGGVQVGVGQYFKKVLLQASYSLGLRDLRAQYHDAYNTSTYPAYYTRSFRASISYMVGHPS